MTEEGIKNIIDGEYVKLQDTHSDRCQIFANLIDIKRAYNLLDYRQSLYVDAKDWIITFFIDLDKKDFGYDDFDISIFSSQLDEFKPEQAVKLYKLLNRNCKVKEIDTDEIEKKIQVCLREYWRNNKMICRLILNLMANNILILFATCCIYVCLIGLALLPAPFKFMEVIVVEPLSLSDYLGLNNMGNALLYIMHGVTEKPLITPINFGGVLIMLFWEFIFWGVIGNFAYQKIVQYFHYKLE